MTRSPAPSPPGSIACGRAAQRPRRRHADPGPGRSPRRLLGALTLALTCLPLAASAQTGPISLTPRLWLRADSIAGTSGAAVATWPDDSGSGNAATQGDPARRPTVIRSALNGLSVVRFDGADDQLALNRIVQDDFTIIAVFKSPGGAANGSQWYQGSGIVDAEVAGVTEDFGMSFTTDGRVLAGTGTDVTVQSPSGLNNTPHIAVFRRTRSTGFIELFVDGRLVGSNTATTLPLTAPSRMVLGSLQTNITYFTGDIAEVLVYGAAVSNDQRRQIETYAAARFGITNLPPANDNRSAAPTLSAGQGSVSGNTTGATVERGGTAPEPSHARNAGGASVWFKWVAPETGQAVFNTLGSDFDTLLAVYELANAGSNPYLTIASNDDTYERWSYVSFRARSGTTYYIAVDGYRASTAGSAATGNYYLNYALEGDVMPAPVPLSITSTSPTVLKATGTAATVVLRGTGFTGTSVVRVNGSACPPASRGGQDCVLTTFRGRGDEIEATLPASLLTSPRLLKFTVRDGTMVSNERGLDVTRYTVVTAPPGQTVGGGVAGGTVDRPGTTVSVSLTCPLSAASCSTTPAIYDGERSGTTLPPPPGTLLGGGLASAISENGAGLITDNGAGLTLNLGNLISDDGSTLLPGNGLGLVAIDSRLVGPDGGSLVGPDGGSLIGPDGGSLIGPDGGSLVGMDGASLRPGGFLSGAPMVARATWIAAPTHAVLPGVVHDAAGDDSTPSTSVFAWASGASAAPAAARSSASTASGGTRPVNRGWFRVRTTGGAVPAVDIAGNGTASVSTTFDQTSLPRLQDMARPILFAVVQNLSIIGPQTLAPTVTEVANGSITITLLRSGETTKPATITYETVDGTARAGRDFVAASGQVTFAAGETSKTITLQVLDDTVGEIDETLYLRLGAAEGSDVMFEYQEALAVTLQDDTDPFTYSLAEGATGDFFDLDIAIANPGNLAAPYDVTFFKNDGSTVTVSDTLAPTSRRTIRVNDVPGIGPTAVSTRVSSPNRAQLLVERTMFWDRRHYGGHTEVAGSEPGTRWYFAEGSQGFFDTYVLLTNANPAPASVTVRFLVEGGSPVVKSYTVPGTARFNVFAGSEPELRNTSFSIVVESDQPISAERAMYFGGRLFEGGHASAGIAQPSRNWFLAEGATGTYFDTFVLLGNPTDTAATVSLRFLLGTGQVLTRTKTVPANSRLTVWLDQEDPLLADAAVSTTIASDVPIIAERAMYWPGGAATWNEAHNSFGLLETSERWGLAEGRVGGADNFETYILLANPNAAATTVTVTFLRANGSTVVKTFDVAATSRFNVHVNSAVPELTNEDFGAIVASETGKPIAVERAMYWNAEGVIWSGGSNATAIKLQ